MRVREIVLFLVIQFVLMGPAFAYNDYQKQKSSCQYFYSFDKVREEHIASAKNIEYLQSIVNKGYELLKNENISANEFFHYAQTELSRKNSVEILKSEDNDYIVRSMRHFFRLVTDTDSRVSVFVEQYNKYEKLITDIWHQKENPNFDYAKKVDEAIKIKKSIEDESREFRKAISLIERSSDDIFSYKRRFSISLQGLFNYATDLTFFRDISLSLCHSNPSLCGTITTAATLISEEIGKSRALVIELNDPSVNFELTYPMLKDVQQKFETALKRDDEYINFIRSLPQDWADKKTRDKILYGIDDDNQTKTIEVKEKPQMDKPEPKKTNRKKINTKKITNSIYFALLLALKPGADYAIDKLEEHNYIHLPTHVEAQTDSDSKIEKLTESK